MCTQAGYRTVLCTINAFHTPSTDVYLLGLPQLTEGFRGEEASDEDQHQSLADESDPRLVQLGYVHGATVDVSVAIRQVCQDSLRRNFQCL